MKNSRFRIILNVDDKSLNRNSVILRLSAKQLLLLFVIAPGFAGPRKLKLKLPVITAVTSITTVFKTNRCGEFVF